MSRSVPILPPPSGQPFLTVEEAAAVLGISRTLAYSLAGEFLTTGSTEGVVLWSKADRHRRRTPAA